MARKLINGHERAMLLKRFMDLNISMDIQEAIAEIFRNIPEELKEVLAQKINQIIDSSKTEQEILEKVAKL